MFMEFLTPESRAALLSAGTGVRFSKNQVLMRQGTVHDAIRILDSGWVKVWAIEDGTERILDLLGPGEILGEMELERGTTRLCWISAMEDLRVITISPERFDRLARERTDIVWALYRTVVHKMRDEHPLRMNTRECHRATTLLRRLATRHGKDADHGYVRVTMPITPQIFRDWSRLNRNAFSRVMKALGDAVRFDTEGLLIDLDHLHCPSGDQDATRKPSRHARHRALQTVIARSLHGYAVS